MKRIILVLTVAAMMVATMTLGLAGSAMAQDIPPPEELDLPSAEELSRAIGFYPDPNAPGCWFGPGGAHVCVPVS